MRLGGRPESGMLFSVLSAAPTTPGWPKSCSTSTRRRRKAGGRVQAGNANVRGRPPAPDVEAALAAFEAHIATIKDQLGKAEALAAVERDRVSDLTAQLPEP